MRTEGPYPLSVIAAALNLAVDEILKKVVDIEGADNPAIQNVLNLTVNASLDYVTGEATSLEEVVANNYVSDDPSKVTVTLDEVMEWILNP